MNGCCPDVMKPARACTGGHGVTKIHGTTKLFVAGSTTAKAGVLSLSDIFGVDSGRIYQDAEVLGKLGYVVAVVNITDGDWANPNDMSGILEWLKKYPMESIEGKLRDVIDYLQKVVGVSTISSYGYCWGAWVGAALFASTNPVIKAHVSLRPSWNVEEMLKGEGAVKKMAEQIAVVPQLLLAAGNDAASVREGGSVIKILKAKNDPVGELSDVVDFPDVVHGWVSRGNLEDPPVKKSVEKAWDTAIKFMQTLNLL